VRRSEVDEQVGEVDGCVADGEGCDVEQAGAVAVDERLLVVQIAVDQHRRARGLG